MSGFSLKDFYIILSRSKAKRRASKTTDGNFARFVIHPHVDSDFFEFGCKVYERGIGRLRIGIETASKIEKAPPIEEIIQICWQDRSLKLNSCIRGYWLEKNVQKSFESIDYSRLQAGDLGIMTVNRKMKTVHIRKNNEPEFLLFENVERLPPSLDIYFCIEKGADMGMVHYHEFSPHIDKEEYRKERRERIENIVSDPSLFSQIKIPLKNKVLNLWKPFFLSKYRKTELEKMDEINDLKDIHLNVSEEVIMEFFLGKESGDVELQSMVEISRYYDLFRRLDMKREMKMVVQKVLSIDNLEVCCDQFSKTVQIFENEEVNEWVNETISSSFYSTTRIITPETFSTSLAFQLFLVTQNILKSMKLKDEEMEKKSRYLQIAHNFKGELKIDDHPDFKKGDNNNNINNNINNNTSQAKKDNNYITLHDTMMKKLRNGVLSNMTLICSDGVKIPAHREILASKMNFFGRMLHFDGIEQDELREHGTIKLENIDSVMCSLILDHVYCGKMEEEDEETEKLEVLIRVLVHAHMFSELTFLIDALEKLSQICLPGSIHNMRDLILQEDVGCMLYGNDNLNKYVVPILRRADPKLSDPKEVYKLIQQSFQKKHREESNESLQAKVECLERKIDVLVTLLEKEKKERVEERKELVSSVDSLCGLVKKLVDSKKEEEEEEEEEEEVRKST